MISRRFSKRDNNHTEIVRQLRARGYQVIELHALGGNCPDIVVICPRGVVFMELKAGRGKLSPGQEMFFATWKGPPGTLVVVRSVEEALAAVAPRCYTVAHEQDAAADDSPRRDEGNPRPHGGGAEGASRRNRRRAKAA